MYTAKMSWEVKEVILSGPGSKWKLLIQYLDLDPERQMMKACSVVQDRSNQQQRLERLRVPAVLFTKTTSTY